MNKAGKDTLLGKIRSLGMTQEDAARLCSISRSRFNAKINGTGGAEFSLGEIRAIRESLKLSVAEAADIFLS